LEADFLDEEARFTLLFGLSAENYRLLREHSKPDRVEIAFHNDAIRTGLLSPAQVGDHLLAKFAALAGWQDKVTMFL
jgi:hypothetical protein